MGKKLAALAAGGIIVSSTIIPALGDLHKSLDDNNAHNVYDAGTTFDITPDMASYFHDLGITTDKTKVVYSDGDFRILGEVTDPAAIFAAINQYIEENGGWLDDGFPSIAPDSQRIEPEDGLDKIISGEQYNRAGQILKYLKGGISMALDSVLPMNVAAAPSVDNYGDRGTGGKYSDDSISGIRQKSDENILSYFMRMVTEFIWGKSGTDKDATVGQMMDTIEKNRNPTSKVVSSDNSPCVDGVKKSPDGIGFVACSDNPQNLKGGQNGNSGSGEPAVVKTVAATPVPTTPKTTTPAVAATTAVTPKATVAQYNEIIYDTDGNGLDMMIDGHSLKAPEMWSTKDPRIEAIGRYIFGESTTDTEMALVGVAKDTADLKNHPYFLALGYNDPVDQERKFVEFVRVLVRDSETEVTPDKYRDKIIIKRIGRLTYVLFPNAVLQDAVAGNKNGLGILGTYGFCDPAESGKEVCKWMGAN